MEARQIKLESDFIPKEADLQDEQRLKAIRKILVGNQIERLESRFEGLSRKVDENNGVMVESMKELKEHLHYLRSQVNTHSEPTHKTNHIPASEEQEMKPSYRSEAPSSLEKALEKLSSPAKEPKLATSPKLSELEKSLEPINRMEENYRAKQEPKPELSDRYSLKDFHEKLDQKVNLEDNKLMLEQRLAELEAKINRISPEAIEEVETRVSHRQERFETETHDLLERLATRVNERFEFAQTEREALEHRVAAIQDILENDILGFLKKGGGSVQGYNIERLKSEMDRQIRENTIRMEAKMEALMDMNQRQMMHNSYEDPKKKALRETLKKLNSLLDE